MVRQPHGMAFLALALVLFAATAGTAHAGLLTGIGGGIAEFTGYIEKAYNEGADVLSIHVDFAVYEPGDFPAADDPSTGADYLYAYQMLNTSNSSLALTAFSVGHDADAVIRNDGYLQDAGSGEVEPDIWTVGSSSTLWGFGWAGGEEVDPADRTSILIYTSPDGPQWDTATTLDGGVPTPVGQLPSPVPEPATLALLALGGGFTLLARRRRRK